MSGIVGILNGDGQPIDPPLLQQMTELMATTTFADIQKLPPAHTLIWSEGEVRIRRYWQLPEAVEYLRYQRPEEYVEQFRELFERTVADRLRTNRAGTRGGMDSTSIAATAYRLMTATGSPVDFRAYARRVADPFGIVYKQLIPDEEGDYATQVAEQAGFPIEYLIIPCQKVLLFLCHSLFPPALKSSKAV